MKSLNYELCSPLALTRVELCSPLALTGVTISLCFNHVATVISPFRPSVFHSLAKFSKNCAIFFSCEKKTMTLGLIHKNVNTSSHIKGNLIALTTVFSSSYDWRFEICPANYHYPWPWNLVWVKQIFELSEVELTGSHCRWLTKHHWVGNKSSHYSHYKSNIVHPARAATIWVIFNNNKALLGLYCDV